MKKKIIKKDNQQIREAVNKTIALYTNIGWKKWFAKIRMWDAPYLEVEKLIPRSGDVLELGCGEGLFANFLAIASKSRRIFGVDIDRIRIKQASRGLKNTKFAYGDATKVKIPRVNTLVMFHLLHHLNSFKDQEKLLEKTTDRIKKRGRLIIVEVEPKFSLKYFAAWFTDHFLVPWLFEKRIYSPIFFRKSKDWVKILKKNGFKCKITSAQKGKPFSHLIIKCEYKKYASRYL